MDTSLKHTASLPRVWDSTQNAAPLRMRGIADASWRLDCFARHMLANWSRARILEWLEKNPTQADAMRARLNHERTKR